MPPEEGEKKIKKLGGYDKIYRIKFEADYLAKLAYEGAAKRYGSPLSKEVDDRIRFELHIMKTMGFQASRGQNLLENLPDRRLGQVAAVRMGEHQIGESSVIPVRASHQFLCLLLFLVGFQHVHYEWSWSQRPRLIVFERAVAEFFSALSGLNQLLAHTDQTIFEVHAVPCKAQQLTGAHPGEDCNRDERFIFMSLHALHQFGEVRGIKRMNFRLSHPGKDTRAGRILLDISDPDRDIECLMQAAVDILNGLGTQPFH